MTRPVKWILAMGTLLLAVTAWAQPGEENTQELVAEQARIESLADLSSSARVVLVRARNRRQEGDRAQAVSLLSAWLEQNPETSVALVYFDLAVNQFALDDTEQALAGFRVAVQTEPRFGRAWLRLGETAYGLEHYEEAARAFDRGRPLTPNASPEILYYAAVSWLQADRPELAVDRLMQLLQTPSAPHPLEWYQTLVSAALSGNLGRQAEPFLDALLAERPADPQAWYLAFQLASGQERHRSAAIYLTITGYLRSLTRSEWVHLGHLYQVLEVPLKAARCYQEAMALTEEPTAADFEQLAGAYLAAHRPEEARQTLRTALDRVPSRQLWSLLGDLEYLQEEFTTALDGYRQSCALDPEFGRGWLMQGYCALELGQEAQARLHLEKALQYEAQATSARALLNQILE